MIFLNTHLKFRRKKIQFSSTKPLFIAKSNCTKLQNVEIYREIAITKMSKKHKIVLTLQQLEGTQLCWFVDSTGFVLCYKFRQNGNLFLLGKKG